MYKVLFDDFSDEMVLLQSEDIGFESASNSIYCVYFASVLLPDQIVATHMQRVQCLILLPWKQKICQVSGLLRTLALTLLLGRSSNV